MADAYFQEYVFHLPEGQDYSFQCFREGKWAFLGRPMIVDYDTAVSEAQYYRDTYAVRIVKISRYLVRHRDEPLVQAVVKTLAKLTA